MIKKYSVSQLHEVMETIVEQKKKAASVTGQTFNGISVADLSSELNKVASDYFVVDDPPIKLTKKDVRYISTGRFFDGEGQKLILLFGLVGLSIQFLSFLIKIPPYAFGIFMVGWFGLFFYLFAKKQRAMRKQIERDFYGAIEE